jgi:hypothetical protein
MTLTDLLAASSNLLEAGGYKIIRGGFPEWETASTRLFEDKYNIVGLAVFPTTSDLLKSWADLQGALVNVISKYVGQGEGKVWDGYLVLLTTGIAPSSDADIEALRYNTSRLRKLVATGEDLSTAGDVERVLRSLLPLENTTGPIGQGTALELLPELLAEQGIDRKITEALVKSFVQQEPLMEAIHEEVRRT